MKSIFDKISDKILELRNKKIIGIDELNFFEAYIKRNYNKDLCQIMDVTISDFLLASIRIIDNKTPFKETKKIIDYIDLEDTDVLELLALNDTMTSDAKEDANLKILDAAFSDAYKSKIFMNLYDKYASTDVFKNTIDFSFGVKLLDDPEISSFFSSKAYSKRAYNMKKAIIDKFTHLTSITKAFNEFDIHIQKLKENIKNQKSIINKEICVYERIIQKLKTPSNPSLIVIPEELESISDEKIKSEIILAVLEKNKTSYNVLLDEYLTNCRIEVHELDNLLMEHNIVITNDSNKLLLIKNINMTMAKKMLNKLSTFESNLFLNDEELLTKILLFSDPNIISHLSGLYNKGILTYDFIVNNIGIFISNKKKFSDNLLEILKTNNIRPCYDELSSNIKLLLDNNIELSNIKKYDINLFLSDSDELNSSLNILNQYNLDLSNPSMIDFSIIDNPNQLNIVDLFIELGLKEFLNSHIEFTSSNINIIKKIILCKELNIPIFDDNNNLISTITRNFEFYIPDCELDKYLDNSTLTHLNPKYYIILEENKNNFISDETFLIPSVQILEKEYKNSDEEYHFGEIIISRNKVLRNMTTLLRCDEMDEKQILINSILYNSILPNESIEKIIDNIENIYSKDKPKSMKKENNQ